MAFKQWDESYSVGVKLIDNQHKHFVGLINALHAAVESNKSDKISDLMHDVAEYADYHFKTEEKYFKKFGYAEGGEHTAMHDDIRARVRGFLARQDEDLIEVGQGLAQFMERWFFVHMKGTDKKYAQFFHEHGIK